MKRFPFKLVAVGIVAALVLGFAGCERGTRQSAASPDEGGATSTAGSAGEPKTFGDTRAKTKQDGQSPSESPTGLSKDVSADPATQTKQVVAPEAQPGQPTNQQKKTDAK